MRTPVSDFIERYAKSGISRFHMPGHKGKSLLGIEKYDITEIDGADVLSTAEGIIGESEKNLTSLYGSGKSFYITEGSTTAICAMLAMIKKTDGEKTHILAARNVHKAFVHGIALLDIEADWLMPKESNGILSCRVEKSEVEALLSSSDGKYSAVYLTSPDYLGQMADIKGISEVCHKYGIPLLVDNAHGAYLKFLDESIHPIDLGADICCDSAHKTLPVLTGGAYLHISDKAKEFIDTAREKIALFSSTSPSYLIMKSMDICNRYLSESFRKELAKTVERVNAIKSFLSEKGFEVYESEPLKIVINAAKSGYSGKELSEMMRCAKMEAEFSDDDYLVLMISPKNTKRDFSRLKKFFGKTEIKAEIKRDFKPLPYPVREMSVREATFKKSEVTKTKDATGKICASVTVSCPPAVPVVISGERITKEVAEALLYYGIDEIKTVIG
ncbi:MAG: aminotransferase class V-fold PLP-dependent enzyme [Clostridia bacterium]|nr:aminotransferase class V-fold PLP-dependent enzyme [Clostridia bacterium]